MDESASAPTGQSPGPALVEVVLTVAELEELVEAACTVAGARRAQADSPGAVLLESAASVLLRGLHSQRQTVGSRE